MDNNTELNQPSFVEQKFADKNPKRILKDKRTGEVFTVHEGLPRESQVEGVFITAPEEPHVFTADTYKLKIGDKTVVNANNVRVIFMHGVLRDGVWYPQDPRLQLKGLTVENIVRSYEDSSNKPVDVLFICNPNYNRVRISSFSDPNERPRIYMKQGNAKGPIMLNQETGEITVEMKADDREQVEFENWKNKDRVRVLPRVKVSPS